MNDLKRLFLIINPISGTRSKEGLDSRIIDGLRRRGFDITAEFTRGSGDATAMARRAVADGFDGVLVCGGDGTINETARSMCGTGVPMGIIPAGSGNGLARHINIPIDPMASLDVIAERRITDCDYGMVNGHHFFCTFGIGFDAAVSDRFAEANTRGRLTYVRSAFQEFISYKSQFYRIVADGEKINNEAFLVAVCNADQYGNNAFIAPDASITDGMLDLVIVPKQPRLMMVMLGMELMAGTLSNNRGIVKRKVRHVTIHRVDNSPAQIDGEPFATAGTDLEISCHPGQLRLFTTATKAPFRPIISPVQAMMNDMGFFLKNIFNPS